MTLDGGPAKTLSIEECRAYASTFGTDSQFYPTYPDNMYEATLPNQQVGCIIIWDSANNQIDPSNRVIFNKHATGTTVSSRRRLCCADPPAPPSAPPPPLGAAVSRGDQVLPHNAYTYTCGAETRMDQQERCKDFADWVSDELGGSRHKHLASLGLDSGVGPTTVVDTEPIRPRLGATCIPTLAMASSTSTTTQTAALRFLGTVQRRLQSAGMFAAVGAAATAVAAAVGAAAVRDPGFRNGAGPAGDDVFIRDYCDPHVAEDTFDAAWAIVQSQGLQ